MDRFDAVLLVICFLFVLPSCTDETRREASGFSHNEFEFVKSTKTGLCYELIVGKEWEGEKGYGRMGMDTIACTRLLESDLNTILPIEWYFVWSPKSGRCYEMAEYDFDNPDRGYGYRGSKSVSCDYL